MSTRKVQKSRLLLYTLIVTGAEQRWLVDDMMLNLVNKLAPCKSVIFVTSLLLLFLVAFDTNAFSLAELFPSTNAHHTCALTHKIVMKRNTLHQPINT